MTAWPVPVITDAEGLNRLLEGTLARLELNIAGMPPLCVVRLDGELRALPDRCPHRGVRLSTGRLDGTAVTCRAHGLSFDVLTGQSAQDRYSKATPYIVTVCRDEVSVCRAGRRGWFRLWRKRRDHHGGCV